MKMASNLVSIFGVNGQLQQTFKGINPDAFVTGFGEHMRTFSQEKRAFNHEDSFMMGGCYA